MSFPSISPKQSFPALESEILAYWKANNTFQKSIDSRPEDNPYRFYDGPPFITGTPHYGSLLSSVVKDVVGRYWTMRGKRVDRVWGWDCHGLPIEEKVQKKLGLSSNKEIEERGVKEFIDGCYEYTESTSAEWEWYIDKIGRWVDMDNAYRTMDQDYMESVMWVFRQLWDKGLIYEGKRVSLYSWKLSTPISNFEVAMDDTYQDVNDPAITVKFKLETIPGALGWVVNEEGKLLLGWSKKFQAWHLPGGGAEPNETYEENLIRELKEELDLTLSADKLAFQLEEKHLGIEKMWNTRHYLIQVQENDVKNNEPEKCTELKWFSKKELREIFDAIHYTDRYPIEVFIGDKPLQRNAPIISILAWTTTPWTIPANMALGVGQDIDYVLVENNSEQFIVAKNRAEAVFKGKGEYTIVREFKGRDLVGLSYTPPFPEYYHAKTGDKTHKIYAADFATDTDGTGIVHLAPEFGDVDFQLAKKEGIPVTEAMDEAGKYTDEIFDYAGTHYLDANRINIDRMKENGTLFKNESITHRVPFCPRSGTPLVQKAQASWFIDIQSQKEKLLEANKKINWFPEHLKFGRFAKGIESAPDWCISRTRFWGAPMPVWMGEDGEKLVVSSREEIFELNKPYGQLTKIIFVRHGRTDYNGKTGDVIGKAKLIDDAFSHIDNLKASLGEMHIDTIYSSPLQRCIDTISPISQMKNIPIIVENGLIEAQVMSAQDNDNHIFNRQLRTDSVVTEGDESLENLLNRAEQVLQKIVSENKGKTIVICSHFATIAAMQKHLHNFDWDTEWEKRGLTNLTTRKGYTPFKVDYVFSDSSKAFNLHRPYIDSIKLQSPKTGKPLTRIKEVLDVWMDSGSMPYAQMHYPFENKKEMEASFPADFIAEYVGQVRAWFYVMHVLGVLLNPNNEPTPTPSFTNVITTGVINGNDGRKMSKSYGNYPDPRDTIEKYGADPIRFYMLNSPLLSGGDMDFKEEGIVETIKSVMLPLWNTYSFFTTYANIDTWEKDGTEVWFARHAETTSNANQTMSDGTDDPDLTEKGREQAKNAGERLREQGIYFDLIIHTGLTRTFATAEIIARETGFSGEYIVDERFIEQAAGEYAGKTLQEIADMHDADVNDHPTLRSFYKNNTTENIEKFEKRILGVYEEILAKYRGKKILIVGHAGTSRPILNQYFGKGLEGAHYENKIGNAEPFRIVTTKLVNHLDRWILSRLQVLIGNVHDAMDGYDVSRACRAIVEYMDELTNWYVRLSRRRFWESGMTADKGSAYETLYTVLVEVSKLLAPFMPFLAESIFQGLTKKESVHLEYVTLPNHHLIDTNLNRDMQICEQIVSLGLALRSAKNIRVRQPLWIIKVTKELDGYYQNIIRDELNVKKVEFENPEKLAKKICKPDARKIGPRFGKDVQYIITEAKNGSFTELEDGKIQVGNFTLEAGEYTIEYLPLENVGDVMGGYGMVVALDTLIDEDLKLEGYARDIIRLIQDMRKDANYNVTDRITLSLSGDDIEPIMTKFGHLITMETLSEFGEIASGDREKTESLDENLNITIKVKR